ncbi:MAG: hypothetical protein JWP31_1469 [Aeromicrobium sp.]|nr:hypothetical protein [Aeromicrobium sp.]
MGRRDASEAWRRDHPWAWVYDRISGGSRLGRAVWKLGMGSDLALLHRTAGDELAVLPDGASVLDLPCGGGVALRDVPPGSRLRYVAADISPAMLDRARAEAERCGIDVELTEADVHELAFADGTFELVLAFTSLHCFPQPRAAVRELVQVLAPGGRLAGSTMLRGSGLRHVPGWIGGRTMGVLGPGCTDAELVRWLEEAGMRDVVLRPAGGLTYFTATRG